MGRLADLQAFVVSARRARTPRDLRRLIGDVTTSMGFDYFALIHHVPMDRPTPDFVHMSQGVRVGVSNYPESWTHLYVQRGMIERDPIVLAARACLVGFKWDDLRRHIRLTPAHEEWLAQGERAGLRNGFSVPIHIPGEPPGSCSFAMCQDRPLLEANLLMAQTVGAFAFEAAREMVLRARRGTAAPALPPPPRLTGRQLECAVLVGRGLTERAIAYKLGLSVETVKRHLKDARNAYDVVNRVQLVARALSDGQISLSDIV